MRLEEACIDYGIVDEKLHNSYADTIATAKLLEKMVSIYGAKEVIYDVMNKKVSYVKEREKSTEKTSRK